MQLAGQLLMQFNTPAPICVASRAILASVFALGIATTLGACGGGSEPAASPTVTTTATVAPAGSPTVTTTATVSPSPSK